MQPQEDEYCTYSVIIMQRKPNLRFGWCRITRGQVTRTEFLGEIIDLPTFLHEMISRGFVLYDIFGKRLPHEVAFFI